MIAATPASGFQAGNTPPSHNTGYLWKIALTGALGGLLFGYDWVVIGGAKHFYEIYFHIGSEWLVGWANSCALLGCLAGSLLLERSATGLADGELSFSRRRSLRSLRSLPAGHSPSTASLSGGL